MRTELGGDYPRLVLETQTHGLAGCHRPDLRPSVDAASDYPMAVGTDLSPVHRTPMPQGYADPPACGNRPQLRRAVTAGGNHHAAVRSEPGRPHMLSMVPELNE